MSDNVTTLHLVNTNAADVENVVQTLALASDDAREVCCPKALVILLDDRGGTYRVIWYNAGMKLSECISLMRVTEYKLVQEMGGV